MTKKIVTTKELYYEIDFWNYMTGVLDNFVSYMYLNYDLENDGKEAIINSTENKC